MTDSVGVSVPTGRQSDRARRDLLTPEGVPLGLRLADRGDRAGAFLIDVVIIFTAIGLLWIMAFFSLGSEIRMSFGLTFSIVILSSFFLRVFYFPFFELRWQGMTPGKRVFGIRVVDRHGGGLMADAVFVRNFMREIEFFIPITLLLGVGQEGAAGWLYFAMLGWFGVFALMPLFNRDRLRVGDMVAGTAVIVVPKMVLLPDLALDQAGPDEADSKAGPETASPYRFTSEQLDVYGIYELQVLEDLLRREAGLTIDQSLAEVGQRIRNKINWQAASGAVRDERAFLEAFYTALRARLEQRMLLGERREDKHHRRGE